MTLATKAAFAPLMRHVRGVDAVVPLTDPGFGGVVRMARQLRKFPWDLVLDAHNILRGHLLLGLMGRRPDRRLAKDTADRLAFLGFGHRRASLNRTMRDRFEELTAGLTSVVSEEAPTLPPLSSLAVAGTDPEAEPVLGLAPGAQWDTKRWPEENFAAILRQRLEERRGEIRIFLGPREQGWFPGSSLERVASRSGRVEIVWNLELPRVAALLSGCNLLVTNDSGLLHVAEAVGTPVLALFGPTVREFGYFPHLPASRVMEKTLDCRPCSRNGKRPCHRGDLACLREIPPEEVYATLNAMEDNR
jgi:heptosyltransferase-2